MKKKLITLTLLAFAGLSSAYFYKAQAHGGEDHAPTKTQTTSGSMDEIEVFKETQFLFDIQTDYPNATAAFPALKLYGRVIPNSSGMAEISAPQSGIVRQIAVEAGQKVRKGQLIAVVEQVLTAAESVQLATDKRNASSELESAEKELRRLRSIADLVAKKDLQNAEIRYRKAQANVAVYNGVSANGGKPFQLQSPIDGVVGNYTLASGAQVEAGETLIRITNPSALRIEAQVYHQDLEKVSEGTQFEIIDEDQHRATAHLITTGPLVNAANQASTLILGFDSLPRNFKIGQFVNVIALSKGENRQLVVPVDAITLIEGKPAVFVHEGPEIFHVEFVQSGEGGAGAVRILKGIHAEDRVVVKGAYQLKSILQNQ